MEIVCGDCATMGALFRAVPFHSKVAHQLLSGSLMAPNVAISLAHLLPAERL